jgi:cytochrome b6-f complex iron-sulfur subunit
MSNKTDEKKEVSRRDFLGLASIGMAVLASIPIIGGAFRMVKANVRYEESTKFKIGMLEDFPVGSVKKIDDRKVFIFSDENGFFAMTAVCTHLGCIVFKTEWGFQCPCHGSQYNGTGKVIGGPAPRPLAWFEISQDIDGTLVVDASKEVAPGTKYKFV